MSTILKVFHSPLLYRNLSQAGRSYQRTSPRASISWSKSYTSMARISPFSKAVIDSMRNLYPECLADKSFDNTGLLLEAPIPDHRPRNSNSVLLTIDLTKAVADEAIEENHSVVVAYHPIIFRGLKAITLEDTQQNSLLRLASHGISVYGPHTAVDIVPGGMADWLCDIVTGKIKPGPEPQAVSGEDPIQPQSPPSEVELTTSEEETETDTDTDTTGHSSDTVKKSQPDSPNSTKRPTSTFHRTYSKPSYPSRRTPSPIQSSPTTTFHPSTISHSRSVITPSPSSALDKANRNTTLPISNSSSTATYDSTNTGSGRLITFETPQPLSTLITRIAHATGQPKGFPVAIPQNSQLETIQIRTVGVCPGSGSSVIRNATPYPPDLVFTGEMSHHEALAVIERGGCVINLFHSNSERGYLEAVMREQLENDVKRRWNGRDKQSDTKTNENGGVIQEILGDDDVRVVVSQRDRDPFGIVILQESMVEGVKI